MTLQLLNGLSVVAQYVRKLKSVLLILLIHTLAQMSTGLMNLKRRLVIAAVRLRHQRARQQAIVETLDG